MATLSTTTPSRVKFRVLTIVVAAVAAAIVFLVGNQLIDGGIVVNSGGTEQQVNVFNVLVSSLLAGLLGWGLLTLLERFTAKARTIWLAVAGVVLLVSLLGPLGATSTGGKVVLVLLHLLVGGVIIGGFSRTVASR